MEKERMWTPREVKEYVGWKNVRTVYRRCKEYEETDGASGLRHFRVGTRQIRIPESAVLALLKSAA